MLPPGSSFEGLLARAALLALAAALIWLALIAAALFLEALTRGRVRVALALGCPRALHRWVLGLAAAAASTAVLVAPPASAERLPLPDRPVVRTEAPARVSGWVRVHPGQSLWEISRRHLPAPATDADVARFANALYRLNRARIGGNPNLIRPGQHLAVPHLNLETNSEDS